MEQEYRQGLENDLRDILGSSMAALGWAEKEDYKLVCVALRDIIERASGWERDLKEEI